MLDLLVRNATLADGQRGVGIAVKDGRIVEVREGLGLAGDSAAPPAHEVLDAEGLLVTPPFVDAHFHMDATLSYGLPRVNASGTLLEGIALWGELKPLLTAEAIAERALAYCDWAVARGLLAIRSHVDVCDPRLLAVQALLDVKKRVAPYLDLQLVAFPQDGVLRSPGAIENLKRALAMGVDVVGGIPHFERTMQSGAESVRVLCELAAELGRLVDMHCDESDDPLSRHVETLAAETVRLGLQGRVTGSHLTSMHSMDNYYVSKLLPLMAEARLGVVANPLINITLQGRHDTYPKRRGMTRVPELLAAGMTVAFGHDCVLDPWYSLGSADMLDVASMGLHVAQMTSQAAMRQCFDAVTVAPARLLHLEGYGLEPGCHADFVWLQARDPIEAIRLRATRLAVYRRGKRVAETPPATAALSLPGRPGRVDFLQRAGG
ncbi:MAG: amidohydrolase family protein [Betaproteobacteria bacterium]|nr:amidohydrolase family protein [Betaproteobacteria bacterium]